MRVFPLPALQALLQDYVYWQDEEDHLRGYPRDSDACMDVIYIRLTKGAHVSTHGDRFAEAPISHLTLPPVRAQVLRLRRSRMARMRDAVFKAVDVLGSFVTEHGLLIEPFKPTFGVRQTLALLLARLGKHFFAEGCDVDAPLADFAALLRMVDLTPLKRRQQRHRVNDVPMVSVLLHLVEQTEDDLRKRG